jgi:hypothetical protein
VVLGGPDFAMVVGFDGMPAVPALLVESVLLVAAAERAVAIVVGSSRRRRGRRTRGERLVRRSADCAVTIAPLGFRARVAGLVDAARCAR